jgi:hypothetical protein
MTSTPLQTVDDRLDGCLVTHRGVNHDVEEVPGRPFDPKMLLDERCPVAVNILGELSGLRVSPLFKLQPVHFLFKWRVDEHMERVRAIAEIVGRAAPDYHRVAFGGRRSDKFFGHIPNTVGICDSQARLIQAAFEAASQESLEQTVM